MSAFDRVFDTARAGKRRIVLPEAIDERILGAAVQAVEKGIAKPVLLGASEAIQQQANKLGLSLDGIEIIDPLTSPERSRYAGLLAEKRAHRGMTRHKAEAELNKPVTFGCLMVSAGDADGCVAGAITPTAQVVSNAMRYVGKRAGELQISSFFIMLMHDWHPVTDVLVIADCALIIDPDSESLAAIAAATGDSVEQLLGIAPEIGMLSFSTAGSARHSTVSKVSKATRLVRGLRPYWRVVGEVQLDAAVIPEILSKKAPDQAASSPCNTLVFPSLDAGNIGYKLIERFGGAQAVGPVLQGLAQPVNDLSRGCSQQDVFCIIAVTAAQCV